MYQKKFPYQKKQKTYQKVLNQNKFRINLSFKSIQVLNQYKFRIDIRFDRYKFRINIRFD